MSRADAAVMLPQTGVARLLTAVTQSDASAIRATGAIPRRHPLVSGGRAPAFLAIELGAQAAAAMTALARPDPATAGPVRGRLVRVTHARFAHATLPVDIALEVTARLVATAPPLAVYEVAITLDGESQVTATLSTYALPQAAA